jgi:plastocyanin
MKDTEMVAKAAHFRLVTGALRFAALALLAACTQGGIPASVGGGASGATHVVDVNLTLNPPVSTPYGESGGMKPPILQVAVGDTIVFTNTDGFAHTSTSLGAARTFPANGPSAIALTQTGATLSGGWTSGAIQAGTSSQVVTADKPGTYLYGCFFHYPAPMRGVIIAR